MENCSVCLGMHPKGDCPVLTTVTGKSVEQLLTAPVIYLTGPPIPDNEAMSYLEDPSDGKKWALHFPEAKIGRSQECDLVLAGDDNVSRVHFIISYEVGKFFIKDPGSRNGTYLNGELLQEKKQLADHDRIRAGRYGLHFVISKAYWAGRLPSYRMRQPMTLTANTLPPMSTTDKELTSAQKAALRNALQAVDHSRRATAMEDAPLPAPSLSKLEAELNELNRQYRLIVEKIKVCESRIAAIKASPPGG